MGTGVSPGNSTRYPDTGRIILIFRGLKGCLRGGAYLTFELPIYILCFALLERSELFYDSVTMPLLSVCGLFFRRERGGSFGEKEQVFSKEETSTKRSQISDSPTRLFLTGVLATG